MFLDFAPSGQKTPDKFIIDENDLVQPSVNLTHIPLPEGSTKFTLKELKGNQFLSYLNICNICNLC